MSFHKQVLNLDAAAETQRIVSALSGGVHDGMHRRGAVLGVSGGVDSSVVLALCVRAFGAQRTLAVILPERESERESEILARAVAHKFGVTPVLEEITGALSGFGCYRRRDEAIRRVFPDYDPSAGYTAKLVLPSNLLQEGTLNVFSMVVRGPGGRETAKMLPISEFRQIVAASNFKQRSRMAMLYYHAELRHYAVVGTANKNEHDQGFFVKHGDGGVDIQPIAHLFKTQVYQLAEYLGVPEAIRRRPPTTDTYSAPCAQEEFFFRMPFETMDLLWYAMEHEVPAGEVAQVMGLSEKQVRHAFDDLTRKRRTTEYLRRPPCGVSGSNDGKSLARRQAS